MLTRGASLGVRLLAAFVLLLTSTYYLLASIPFAYYQFLESPPFRWMPVFVRLHPVLIVAAVGTLLGSPSALEPAVRDWARRFILATVTVAVCMAGAFWIPGAESYELAAVLSFAPLAMLAGAAALHLGGRQASSPPRPPLGEVAAIAGLAGAAASTAYAINAACVEGAALTLHPRELMAGSAFSLAADVIMFSGAALVMSLVRQLAAKRCWSPSAARLAVGAVVAGIVAVLIRRAVLTTLMFDDRRSLAFALGTSLVAFWSAFVVNPRIDDEPLPRPSGGGPVRAAIGIITIGLLVFAAPPPLRLVDWGFSFQKLIVMATWMVAAALMTTTAARRRLRSWIAGGLMLMWALTVGQGALRAAGGLRREVVHSPFDLSLAVERYATFDMSLRVVLDVVRPMIGDRAFLSTLRRVGDVTDDRRLGAVPLQLFDFPQIDSSYRPHIFIVVIDSLRPDYLSAYNPAVTFTPAIGAFARESIVMRRAFTPYSGTALSEPALWAGGLIPRTLYVKPFSLLDNLERLIVAGGYRRYISIDEVLARILEDRDGAGGMVRLDAHIVHPERENEAYKLDLCSTVDELTARLDADEPTRPIFFYSQPKNLHIRVIAGEAPRFDKLRAASDTFFQPAVTTIGRLDGCFGRFIDYLKNKKLYDDSIVLLTSDHGDAYGEQGRWGHAFYVAPETLRVPLIMHVPERLRAVRRWDDNAVAWLTDITPTLAELLGDPRISGHALMGRPLLIRPQDAHRAPRRGPYLVQSELQSRLRLDRSRRRLAVHRGCKSLHRRILPTERPQLAGKAVVRS